jgi:hypothetical protein
MPSTACFSPQWTVRFGPPTWPICAQVLTITLPPTGRHHPPFFPFPPLRRGLGDEEGPAAAGRARGGEDTAARRAYDQGQTPGGAHGGY